MNRTPTLGKIRKKIDSRFRGNDRWGNGNDRKDKKGEERDICRYNINIMVRL